MNAYVEQFTAWWSARQPREQQILLVGAIVVAIALVDLAVWTPVSKAHRRAELALQQSRTLANRLETIAAEVEPARSAKGPSAANRNLSLLAAVDQASHGPTLGKEPSRIQPEGDKEVKLWVDDVAFDALLNFIQQLQAQYGIVVGSAELERKSEGQVGARLSLVRP